MSQENNNTSPFSRETCLLALVCIMGPALISLVPMAAAPALPAMAAEFGGEQDGQLFSQFIMTMPAIMIIVSAPITGLIIERFGERRCLLSTLVLYTITGFGVYFVNDSNTLIALRLMLGVAAGAILTTCLTLIGDRFSGTGRELLLGLATALSSVFAAVAIIFGGTLVDIGGWRAPFALYLLGLPVFIAAFTSVPRLPVLSNQESKDAMHFSAHKPLLAMWAYYLMLVLLIIGMFSPSIQGPFVLEARGIDSANERGLIVGATSLVAIFSAASYGKLRTFMSAYRLLMLNAFCMGSGLIIFSTSTDFFTATLGCAIVGIGAGMSEPAIASIIFDRTPTHTHGLGMGLIVSSLSAGQFLNPWALNPIRQWSDLETALLILGIVIIAAGLLLAAVKFRGRREATA